MNFTFVHKRVRSGAFCVIALLLLVSMSSAQAMKRTVGITGTTMAGSSFTLEIDAGPTYVRAIDFGPLESDFSPAAMAELMVLAIEDDYFLNEETGFRASNVNSKPKNKEFDATFVITCTAPINRIRVGMLGNPNVPIPRAPGVAFNPNVITFDANFPIPFLGPQPAQPNATMAINGVVPTFDLFRREKILTGQPMTLSVSSAPNINVPFTLLSGVYNPGSFVAPWGDTLDIGTYNAGAIPNDLQVIGDGLTPGPTLFDAMMRTDFVGNWQITVVPPPTLNGFFGFAYQALVFDPTNSPLALRLTNAVQPLFNTGQRFSFTPPADGSVQVPFTPGFTFDFYGATYSSVFVHENGYLTFGGAGGLTNVVNASAAVMGQPAIFANWSDWDLSGSQIDIFQFGDELRIQWGNQAAPISHFGEADGAEFTCILRLTQPFLPSLDAGGILLDYNTLDPLSLTRNDAFIGVTPGLNLDMAPPSRDIGGLLYAGLGNSSVLMQHNALGGFASRLSVESGGQQIYHNGSGLAGRDLAFFPASLNGISAGRPFAIPSSPNPKDVQAIIGQSVISTMGGPGQQLVISGYFKYLFSGATPPQVVLDPQGTQGVGPYPLDINAIFDDSGVLPFPVSSVSPQPGFRNFEAIVVQTVQPLPPVALPTTVDLEVVFPTGASFVLPGAVQVIP